MTQPAHITGCQTFFRCRLQYWWQEVLELVAINPNEPNEAIETGVIIHKALETYYDHPDRGGEMALAAALRVIDGALLDDNRFTELCNIVEGYITYANNLSEDEAGDAHLEILHVESQAFSEMQAYTTAGQNIVGSLVGTFDLVVRWKGAIWIVDHKTSRTLRDYDDIISDDQMAMYVWLAQRVFGEPIAGVIYNQLRSKSPSTPTLNQNGEMSRRNIDTTWDIYKAALLTAGLDPEAYEDMQTKLCDKVFYRREIVPIPADRVEAAWKYWQRMVGVLAETHQTVQGHPLTPEAFFPNATRMCYHSCPYYAPCRLYREGGDPQPMLDSLYQTVLNHRNVL